MKPSKTFLWVLTVLAVVVGASGLAWLHLENARLRRHLANRFTQQSSFAQLRRENEQLRSVLALRARDSSTAADSVRSQIERAKTDLANLEKLAAQRHAEKAAQAARDADALAHNRDPLQGFARLEHFRDCGQATPAAALQTMVWAAIHGDEATLRKVGAMNSGAREQARALIARLPEDAQARWTPEKLAMLWGMGALTELSAMHITRETILDADHATVSFRAPGTHDEENVKLTRTPAGWAVVISSGAISKLEKKLAAAGADSP